GRVHADLRVGKLPLRLGQMIAVEMNREPWRFAFTHDALLGNDRGKSGSGASRHHLRPDRIEIQVRPSLLTFRQRQSHGAVDRAFPVVRRGPSFTSDAPSRLRYAVGRATAYRGR